MRTAPLFLLVLAAACSKAAEPVEQRPVRRASDAPRPAINDSSRFAGTVELSGGLESASEGLLLVMLRAVGKDAPLWAYMVDLRDPEPERAGLVRRDDGSRALVFTLSRDTTLIGAPLPPDVPFEVAALYDPDGDIDSKDGQVVASAPARRGDLGIRMELSRP
jgi:hypothetical protein